MKKVQRIEKHLIKKSSPYFKMIEEFCFKSKNLYNSANYYIRQEFIKNKKYLNYNYMDKFMKTLNNEGFKNDYREMPTAQSAQQILKLLDKNWHSFFKAIKDWTKHPEKYLSKPSLPKYKKKNQMNILILTNSNCKLKEGKIKFPKVFNGFEIATKVNNLQQVRIIPSYKCFTIEIIYNEEIKELKEDNGKYIGIDIGVNNLAAISSNTKIQTCIINGRKLKAINQYFNKKKAYYTSIIKMMNNKNISNRINRLSQKRKNVIMDLLHKASKKVIEYTLNCEANTIIIGHNKDWKQEINQGKINNQNFVSIPFNVFIQMIQYKAETKGINVILTEESYTSGTSWLDKELPIKEYYDKSRRKKRGLFVSNTGKRINADINASYQMIKKVFPNAFSNGIEDYGYNPIRVDL